jgi:hypothetical protein
LIQSVLVYFLLIDLDMDSLLYLPWYSLSWCSSFW